MRSHVIPNMNKQLVFTNTRNLKVERYLMEMLREIAHTGMVCRAGPGLFDLV